MKKNGNRRSFFMYIAVQWLTMKKGFTLIELLVVIVIIGILATIGVATFQGYFERARDTKKQTAVSTITNIIKANGLGKDSPYFGLSSLAAVNALLSEQGYTVPAQSNGHCIFYAYGGGAGDNFFVMAVKEADNSEYFLGGTDTAITNVNTDTAASAALLDPDSGACPVHAPPIQFFGPNPYLLIQLN